jgi:hypothetical protein
LDIFVSSFTLYGHAIEVYLFVNPLVT